MSHNGGAHFRNGAAFLTSKDRKVRKLIFQIMQHICVRGLNHYEQTTLMALIYRMIATSTNCIIVNQKRVNKSCPFVIIYILSVQFCLCYANIQLFSTNTSVSVILSCQASYILGEYLHLVSLFYPYATICCDVMYLLQ
jgi:hypothetical protein